MTTYRNTKTLSKIVLLWVAASFFVACNSDPVLGPTAPDSSQLTVLAKSGPGGGGGGNGDPNPNSSLLQVRKREDAENGVSTAIIGPEGGTLFHAAHRLVVPPGALSEPTELSFSMPVSDTLMFEFGPDGISFNLPVQVFLSFDHAFNSHLDETLYKIVFLNTTTGGWQAVPTTVDTEANEVTGGTLHFSRYAISKG